MKNLDDLVMYTYKRYTYPKSWWSKAHFEKRCLEIYTSEQIILKCMDKPFVECKDIIENYIFELYGCRKESVHTNTIKKLNIMISTAEHLYTYLS